VKFGEGIVEDVKGFGKTIFGTIDDVIIAPVAHFGDEIAKGAVDLGKFIDTEVITPIEDIIDPPVLEPVPGPAALPTAVNAFNFLKGLLLGGGKIGKVLSKAQVEIATKTAQVTRKGSTVIGHALSKHAGRNPEIWGKTTGSMKNWNAQGMKHFQEIIDGPGKFKQITNKGVTFLEKRLPDGRGIRLNMDSTFKGFI
jgi:hypothetical protein